MTTPPSTPPHRKRYFFKESMVTREPAPPPCPKCDAKTAKEKPSEWAYARRSSKAMRPKDTISKPAPFRRLHAPWRETVRGAWARAFRYAACGSHHGIFEAEVCTSCHEHKPPYLPRWFGKKGDRFSEVRHTCQECAGDHEVATVPFKVGDRVVRYYIFTNDKDQPMELA